MYDYGERKISKLPPYDPLWLRLAYSPRHKNALYSAAEGKRKRKFFRFFFYQKIVPHRMRTPRGLCLLALYGVMFADMSFRGGGKVRFFVYF